MMVSTQSRPMDKQAVIDKINAAFLDCSLLERVGMISHLFDNAVFTTSLGKEDQAISHAVSHAIAQSMAGNNSIAKSMAGNNAIAQSMAGNNNIKIVTLNTGRLFDETLKLLSETKESLSIDIEEYFPEANGLSDYIGRHGVNGFYDSVEARHACCFVRKIEPLQRALKGADAWVTGLRREQSQNRAEHSFAEWDADNKLIKVNPLIDWKITDLDLYIEANQVPINPMHLRGFPSIGCEPCTRAIKPGEDERAGRWWWENDQTRECGLHVSETVSKNEKETA